MESTFQIAITGAGFWCPTLPDWEAAVGFLRGKQLALEQPMQKPAPKMLAANERRRAPESVVIALEAASQACAAAGLDGSGVPSIFASAYGDLAINDYLCRTLAEAPKMCSPTRFHNSVHNAAAGYWTIGTGCNLPSTAMAAGESTFASGLLESVLQVAAEESPVLLVAYDMPAHGPLTAFVQSDCLLGVAFVLAPVTGPVTTGELARVTVCSNDVSQDMGASPSAVWEEVVSRTPIRNALLLVEALAANKERTIRYRLGSGTALELAIVPTAGDRDEI
jgi:hypothetical protein